VLNHFGGSSGNRSFRRLCTASLRSRLGMLVLISEHLLSRARQRAVLSYVKRAEPPKRLSTRIRWSAQLPENNVAHALSVPRRVSLDASSQSGHPPSGRAFITLRGPQAHGWPIGNRPQAQSACYYPDETRHGPRVLRLLPNPLLTPEWKDSQWTRYETYGAEHIIPIILRGDWKEIATPPLAQYQYDALDLTKATDPDWARLIKRIRDYRDQPRLERSAKDRLTLLKHRP